MLKALDADLEMVRETTAKFLGNESPLGSQRQSRSDSFGFDREFWRRGAELGWTSFLVSEDHGGGSVSGNGLADLSLIANEFGRTAAPGPLIGSNLVAAALDGIGGDHQSKVLAGILNGTEIVAYCVEEGPRAPVLQSALMIRRDGDDLVLRGVKRPVEAAAQADHFLVTGSNELGLSQVLVPKGSPGLTVKAMESVDLTRRFACVEFNDVRVPATFAVGDIGGAEDNITRLFHIALVLLSSEMVGAMERAFEMTLEWAFDRYSFGRPLASYQELKHRFADMKCWLEASHAITDAAASGSHLADELASAAKAYTGQYGGELIQDCVQIHGGIGLTFDHDLHILLRRHTVDRMLFGGPTEHRQRLALFSRQGG